MADKCPSPKHTRRWLESLTTAALLAVAFLVGMSLLLVPAASMLKSFSRDRDEWRYELMREQVVSVRTGKTKGLYFYDVPNPDRILEEIEPLDALESIGFEHSAVTAAGIEHLITQPNLREVTFHTLDDRLIAALATLPHLESLDIVTVCCLTDDGVRALCDIPTLRSLTLSFLDRPRNGLPHMTDAALSSLSSCTQLRAIRLEGDWFSDAALAQLRAALPDCEIEARRFEKAERSEAGSAAK